MVELAGGGSVKNGTTPSSEKSIIYSTLCVSCNNYWFKLCVI